MIVRTVEPKGGTGLCPGKNAVGEGFLEKVAGSGRAQREEGLDGSG